MSASRAASTVSGARRARTSALKSTASMPSGMTDPRHAVERREQRVPAAALAVEHLLAFGGDAIEPPPPRAGALDPLAVNQSAALEAIEGRVERRDVKL